MRWTQLRAGNQGALFLNFLHVACISEVGLIQGIPAWNRCTAAARCVPVPAVPAWALRAAVCMGLGVGSPKLAAAHALDAGTRRPGAMSPRTVMWKPGSIVHVQALPGWAYAPHSMGRVRFGALVLWSKRVRSLLDRLSNVSCANVMQGTLGTVNCELRCNTACCVK